MLGLARRMIRRRLAAFVASFVALSFAALIVAVCGGLLETGLRDDVPAQRLAAAPIVVAGTQEFHGSPLSETTPLAADVSSMITALPGVARTVSDVSFPVSIGAGAGAGAAQSGHGWSSAGLGPFTLVAGRAPSAADEVVIGRERQNRAPLGTVLTGTARGAPVSLRVVGIVTGPANNVFLTDAQAQSLIAQPGTADAVAVFPAPGTSAANLAARIRTQLGNAAGHPLVLTGTHRGRAEFPGSAAQSTDLIPLAAASGGLMTAVSVFIIATTLALSVQLRRRPIALLRTIGATPGQLRRLVVGETVLLAIPAVGVGLLFSQAVGRHLLAAFADHGLVADELVYHQSYIPTLAAVGATSLTALVAALVAARSAVSVRPVEALRADTAVDSRLGWPRLIFGLLVLAGAIALAVITALVFNGPIAASTAEPSAMLWTLALALLAPGLIRPVIAVLGRVASIVAPRTGVLARETLNGRGRRSAAVAIPVLLATGLTTGLLYLQTTQQSAIDSAYAQHLSADRVLTSTTGQMPLALAGAAARVPGVASAAPVVTSTGFFDATTSDKPDDVPLQAVEGQRYRVLAGDISQVRGQSVAIAAEYRRPGRDVGDTVALRFGDNSTAQLRIGAVVQARRGYPIVLVPAALLASHTTTGLADQILIVTARGSDPDAALARLGPDLRVADRTAALTAFSDQQQTGQWVGYLFIAALIVYTGVSLINTTVAATRQRRPQLRTLGLVGATRRQILRVMTIEAAIVSAAGVVLGSAAALAVLLPFDRALGRPGLPSGPWWIFAAVAGSALVITVVVTRASVGATIGSAGRQPQLRD